MKVLTIFLGLVATAIGLLWLIGFTFQDQLQVIPQWQPDGFVSTTIAGATLALSGGGIAVVAWFALLTLVVLPCVYIHEWLL